MVAIHSRSRTVPDLVIPSDGKPANWNVWSGFELAPASHFPSQQTTADMVKRHDQRPRLARLHAFQ